MGFIIVVMVIMMMMVQAALRICGVHIRGFSQLWMENMQEQRSIVADMSYAVRPRMVVSAPNVCRLTFVIIPQTIQYNCYLCSVYMVLSFICNLEMI